MIKNDIEKLPLNGQLSAEQKKRLFLVAGDHAASEDEWVRACLLLGNHKFIPKKERETAFLPVLLGVLLALGSFAGWSVFNSMPREYSPALGTLVPTIETALPPATVTNPYSVWMPDLQRRIKRAWFPPKGNESRRVTVRFKVLRNGRLTELRLRKSSGVDLADIAALKAVENAAPFRHLPTDVNDVDVEFTFDYNVFVPSGSSGYAGTDAFSSSGSTRDGDAFAASRH